jgi:hypothetical protein
MELVSYIKEFEFFFHNCHSFPNQFSHILCHLLEIAFYSLEAYFNIFLHYPNFTCEQKYGAGMRLYNFNNTSFLISDSFNIN